MAPRTDNIFEELPKSPTREQFLTLFENAAVKIERIVSPAATGPSELWYDQPHDEWVMVVRGRAALEFEGGGLFDMREGDHIAIPSRVKHRVHRTDPDTVWLAVHVKKP